MSTLDSATSVKRRSIILIASLLAASLLTWGGIQLAFGQNSNTNEVRVIDSEGTTHLIPLEQNETHTFTTSLGTNVVEVKDGSARMASSGCPNHDCVSQGSINSAAQMIVCMPHQLIVEISSKEEVQ